MMEKRVPKILGLNEEKCRDMMLSLDLYKETLSMMLVNSFCRHRFIQLGHLIYYG